jgi:hypothetical protein
MNQALYAHMNNKRKKKTFLLKKKKVLFYDKEIIRKTDFTYSFKVIWQNNSLLKHILQENIP